MNNASLASIALTITVAASAAAANPRTTTVDFSNGTEGWATGYDHVGRQGSWIAQTPGAHGAVYRTRIADTFGLTWGTDSNAAFLGDYTSSQSVSLGLDVKTTSISFGGTPVSRDLIVELRDYDNTTGGAPWTSVWYQLGTLESKRGWQHLSVTIADTLATALPAGWQGYGPDDSSQLPPGVSFSDILKNVDQIVFTTYVPGYFYGFTDFNVAVDNISITAAPVPEPATVALQLGGLAMLGWFLRRRQR